MPPVPPTVSEPCCDGPYRPRSLLLQWHVTERCNLRCAHCYQEQYAGEELPLAALRGILDQFTELLASWQGGPRGRRVPGQVTVTGGEPFLRSDCFDLLELLAARRRQLQFAVLTNGSLLDDAVARRLRRLRPAFVQVSVEGTRQTHDGIRGPGNFDRTVAAIRRLVGHRIATLISFSAHRGNYREFAAVADLGRELGVTRVWADRVIPFGSGAAMKDHVLTPDQTRELFQIMHDARSAARRRWFRRTQIAMHRALQFLVGGGTPYRCTAGDSLITIGVQGDLYPCRRMPIRVGNVLETPLAKLYQQSELFRRLRDGRRVSDGCEGCAYARLCGGGLRCLSYAITGNPLAADPGCWHATRPDQVALGR